MIEETNNEEEFYEVVDSIYNDVKTLKVEKPGKPGKRKKREKFVTEEEMKAIEDYYRNRELEVEE